MLFVLKSHTLGQQQAEFESDATYDVSGRSVFIVPQRRSTPSSSVRVSAGVIYPSVFTLTDLLLSHIKLSHGFHLQPDRRQKRGISLPHHTNTPRSALAHITEDFLSLWTGDHRWNKKNLKSACLNVRSEPGFIIKRCGSALPFQLSFPLTPHTPSPSPHHSPAEASRFTPVTLFPSLNLHHRVLSIKNFHRGGFEALSSALLQPP